MNRYIGYKDSLDLLIFDWLYNQRNGINIAHIDNCDANTSYSSGTLVFIPDDENQLNKFWAISGHYNISGVGCG